MDQSLYRRLAPEWNEVLSSGAVFAETDETYYSRPEVKAQFADPDLQHVSMLDIATTTAHHFNMSRAELMCRSRLKEFIKPRSTAIYLIREVLPHIGTVEIGRFFGRDHTTIGNSLRRAAELLETDPTFAGAVAAIRDKLGGVYPDR